MKKIISSKELLHLDVNSLGLKTFYSDSIAHGMGTTRLILNFFFAWPAIASDQGKEKHS